jgi:hypothetical protein
MASIHPTSYTYVNYGRGYLNKNLSQIFKSHSFFPGMALGIRLVKLGETMIFQFGEGEFGRGNVVFGPPPWVVSGIRRWGWVQVHLMVKIVLNGFPYHNAPLVKARMARGGPM